MVDLNLSNIKPTLLLSFLLFGLLNFSTAQSLSNPAQKPSARWGHVFIANPNDNSILLFGGSSKRGGPYLNDTWIWKNDQWKQLEVDGPSPRGFCAVTYHIKRKTIILHGGRGDKSKTYTDTWEWNGSSWQQINSDTSFKADHHQMVYLEDKNALLAFGGWDGEEVSNKTWLWQGKWKQLSISSPPKRAAFGMAYNKKTKKVNLYGGLWIKGQYADIWEWSEGQWSALTGPYDNSSLDHHHMIYDGQLESIIGFGGKDYRYKEQMNTFKVDNNKITTLSSEGPPKRHSFGFTYDQNAKLAYLYGGKVYKNEQRVALDDFWMWDGSTWTKIN